MTGVNNTKFAQGFTLIELIITVSIIAIIATIAAPNFSRQLAGQRITNTTGIIEASLKEAVSESSIRRQTITYAINTTDSTIKLIDSDDSTNIIRTYNLDERSDVTAKARSATDNTSTFSPVTEFQIEPSKRLLNQSQTDSIIVQFEICDNGVADLEGKTVQANAKVRTTLSINRTCS